MRKQELTTWLREHWSGARIVKIYRQRGTSTTLWYVDYYCNGQEFPRTMTYAQQAKIDGKWVKL